MSEARAVFVAVEEPRPVMDGGRGCEHWLGEWVSGARTRCVA
jgi:hypothetical protein